MRTHVALRLCFVKLPTLSEERIFRATLEFSDPESCSYQDLAAIIENKLIFMEVHNGMDTVTVFFKEANGDRVVVDDCYFAHLVRQWARAAARQGRRGSSSESGSVDREPRIAAVSASFEIEVTKSTSFSNLSSSPPPQVATGQPPPRGVLSGPRQQPTKASTPLPLTIENLSKLPIASLPVAAATLAHGDGRGGAIGELRDAPAAPAPVASEANIRIGALTCPPRHSPFFLRCVILAIRFKTPKPGLTVAELDLGDREAPTTERITAVTFDEQVQRAIRQNLRSDLRQVVEIRHCLVRHKSEVEKRFQTNAHPLLLRLDRSCNIEVVQLLAAPLVLLPDRASAIVTVRDRTQPVGVLDLSDMASLGRPRDGGATAVVGSSSSSSGPARTVFSLSGGALRPKAGPPSSHGAAAAAQPQTAASLGMHLQHQQQAILAAARGTAEAAPHEHGLPSVTAQDVTRREPLVEQQANRAEIQKQRIRHRSELSMECFLCGLNVEAAAPCMERVRYLLGRNARRAGLPVPTLEELREALTDPRTPARAGSKRPQARLYCETHFVRKSTRTLHVVHPRCAHLCTDYQEGKPMEDMDGFRLAMNVCALCGGEGACVRCYHPDCNEQFHVVCALFSGGYVNFGKKDPYRPCPACPRHTLVSMDNEHILGADGDLPRGGKNENLWAEDIVFDSNEVGEMDLRDPDTHNEY
ncbi:hypothetical protein STCU_06946 [Strigomonas culicis]|uniref:PHD-type domain-containing protein n=1 Tax=Strigomonas culicis TaxID=28005 RepID=S9U7W2_9TRYP|nr:hypothetical protein STCU_06946 [Strigomonas culicis]|eukprot:EPY24904.1 hypothetical protein STCU_06946 [Strigomonas culicis]